MSWYGSGFIPIIIYSSNGGNVTPSEDDLLLMTGDPLKLMSGDNLLLME